MGLKLMKRNDTWHVEGRVMGQRVRQSTRLPAQPAYRAMAEKERLRIERSIIEGTQLGSQVLETFQDAADMYLQWKRIENKWSFDMQAKVEKLCDTWGAIRLTDITPAAIQTFVAQEWGHLKPSSIRRYLNDFRSVLNHAKKSIVGYAGCDVPMPYVNDVRDVHFDENEANAFLAWVTSTHEHYYPHFLTLIDTGVRLNEMLSLRSTAFSNDVLRVRRRLARTGKTKTRDIPLTDDMEKLAARFRSLKATEPLYVAASGKPWSGSDSASATLGNVLKRGLRDLGLPDTGDDAMRVHDLRHTFAYLTAKAGADIGDLQYLMGHEDIGMTMRYRGFIQSRARTFVGLARRDAVM